MHIPNVCKIIKLFAVTWVYAKTVVVFVKMISAVNFAIFLYCNVAKINVVIVVTVLELFVLTVNQAIQVLTVNTVHQIVR